MRLRWLAGLPILALLLGPGSTAAEPADPSMETLLQQLRDEAGRRSEAQRQREARFLAQRDRQRELLSELETALAVEQSRGEQLRGRFDNNERELAELSEQLRQRVGTLGELFGVARQAAGEVKAMVDVSMVSAELPHRIGLAEALAGSEGLPAMRDLDALRILLLEEMAETARIGRLRTDVIGVDGLREERDVVRVGAFAAISGDRFLEFRPESVAFRELPRQPAGRYRSMAAALWSAGPGDVAPMAIDPTRGGLLALLIESPGLVERLQQGGWVGFTIIALGVMGLILGVERLWVLGTVSRAIRRQLHTPRADDGNPLGRILAVFDDSHHVDTQALELRLEEAILRETPGLERRQGYLKVIAAVAPLLGLLGTVVGMIITFQAIVLFGTGDPQLMANGISQALVTTALGLVVAIPMVFLYSVVAGRSRALVEILEEQAAGMVARHAEALLATPSAGPGREATHA